MSELRLKEQDFEGYVGADKCVLINLANTKGALVQLSNYGARIASFIVPDKNGLLHDIVIGPASLEGYKKASERYFNAVVGRYAGRIAHGKFKLGGREYSLSVNNPPNHLHGGFKGLNEQVWKICDISSNSAEMSCFLPAGLDGYPGDFSIKVRYTLTDENALLFEVHAQCSEESVLNITNHAFFNLGDHSKDVLDHKLFINAAHYLPVDKNLIPSGDTAEVKNTPFDFTSFKKIGAELNADDAQLKYCGGYDHSFVCDDYNGRNLFLGAAAINCASGLKLEVLTTQPSVHFYGCNFLSGKDSGKGGAVYKRFGAFCLETQHFPDSPNHADFPSTAIKPGEDFTALTVYRVSDI